MAADVARFSVALDKVYKTMSTQEVHLDAQEMRGLAGRSAREHIERKFQQQLQRARAAFLQEFRNHSVVVESEVKRIREELTEHFEAKHGERIAQLKAEAMEAASVIQKQKDDIASLNDLVGSQESYLAAVRHRCGLDSKEGLRKEIGKLKEDLHAEKQANEDLSHQLLCRDELVLQLRTELGGMQGELRRHTQAWTEKQELDGQEIQGLRQEMHMQRDKFASCMHDFRQQFREYKAKTDADAKIQDILNARCMEALRRMDEERQRHVKARTKPSNRINQDILGPDKTFEEYALGEARYRVDAMGMDTSWKDYSANTALLPPSEARRVRPPKFRVERLRQSAQRVNLDPVAPSSNELGLDCTQLPPHTSR